MNIVQFDIARILIGGFCLLVVLIYCWLRKRW